MSKPAAAKPATAPAKPADKAATDKPAADKAAAEKPAAAKAEAAKPAPAKPAPGKPGAKSDAALPDAALLDREGEDGPAADAAPASQGSRWLPKGKWRWVAIGAAAVVVICGSAAAAYLATRPAPVKSPIIAGPAQVINGRMLVIAGQTIRLQAIDAPPAELICRDGAWEYKCGADSRKALEQLVGNRPVDCESVFTDDGVINAICQSEQGIDIAAALVESGWAVADLRRSSRYLPQQVKAQDQGLGLWRNNFAHPEQWRLAARGVR